MQFWKKVLDPGVHVTPDGVLNATKSRISRWVKKHKKMSQAGLNTYFPWGHQPKAYPNESDEEYSERYQEWASKYNAGHVLDMKQEKDGSCWVKGDCPAVHKIDDKGNLLYYAEVEGQKKLCSIGEVSVGLDSFIDGKGRAWYDVPVHVALTTRPVWSGQEGFKALSVHSRTRDYSEIHEDFQYTSHPIPVSMGMNLSHIRKRTGNADRLYRSKAISLATRILLAGARYTKSPKAPRGRSGQEYQLVGQTKSGSYKWAPTGRINLPMAKEKTPKPKKSRAMDPEKKAEAKQERSRERTQKKAASVDKAIVALLSFVQGSSDDIGAVTKALEGVTKDNLRKVRDYFGYKGSGKKSDFITKLIDQAKAKALGESTGLESESEPDTPAEIGEQTGLEQAKLPPPGEQTGLESSGKDDLADVGEGSPVKNAGSKSEARTSTTRFPATDAAKSQGGSSQISSGHPTEGKSHEELLDQMTGWDSIQTDLSGKERLESINQFRDGIKSLQGENHEEIKSSILDSISDSGPYDSVKISDLANQIGQDVGQVQAAIMELKDDGSIRTGPYTQAANDLSEEDARAIFPSTGGEKILYVGPVSGSGSSSSKKSTLDVPEENTSLANDPVLGDFFSSPETSSPSKAGRSAAQSGMSVEDHVATLKGASKADVPAAIDALEKSDYNLNDVKKIAQQAGMKGGRLKNATNRRSLIRGLQRYLEANA